MKKIVFITVTLLLLSGVVFTIQAQQIKVVEIQTSAQCEMCKERLESNLSFEKGIKNVKLDMETKKLSVTYKSSKTDINAVKNTIVGLGYDADDLKANPEAYKNLPMCCKKPGDKGNISHQ